eukprot:6443878-Heterocapsa_arctica.AAC.1
MAIMGMFFNNGLTDSARGDRTLCTDSGHHLRGRPRATTSAGCRVRVGFRSAFSWAISGHGEREHRDNGYDEHDGHDCGIGYDEQN